MSTAHDGDTPQLQWGHGGQVQYSSGEARTILLRCARARPQDRHTVRYEAHCHTAACLDVTGALGTATLSRVDVTGAWGIRASQTYSGQVAPETSRKGITPTHESVQKCPSRSCQIVVRPACWLSPGRRRGGVRRSLSCLHYLGSGHTFQAGRRTYVSLSLPACERVTWYVVRYGYGDMRDRAQQGLGQDMRRDVTCV